MQNLVLCAWGALDPKTGLVSKKASLKGAEQKLLDAIEDARKGVFTPNRENDELTRALGNPEHPGRTRGKGVIPWYEGFSEWNDDYRTRERKKMEEEKKRKLEEEQRKQDAERLQGLEARHADLALKFQQQQQQIDSLSQEMGPQQRQQQADDHPALDSTVPSIPRSSVVPPRATHCWIHTLWMTS